MRRFTTLLTTTAFIVGLSGMAQAASLFGGSLAGGPLLIAGNSFSECLIVNLGPLPLKDVVFQITIEETVVTSDPETVPPGDVVGSRISIPSSTTRVTWCEVKFRGIKKNVRGTLCIGTEGDDGNCEASIPLQ